jgi:hypothetical protein
MWVAVGEVAADGRDIAHADIGMGQQGFGEYRRGLAHRRRPLDLGEPHHRADRQPALGGHGDAGERRPERAQAHQALRPVEPRFHHQHQRGAAGDRPHIRVVGIEQRQRLGERTRLDQLERGHCNAIPNRPVPFALSRL